MTNLEFYRTKEALTESFFRYGFISAVKSGTSELEESRQLFSEFVDYVFQEHDDVVNDDWEKHIKEKNEDKNDVKSDSVAKIQNKIQKIDKIQEISRSIKEKSEELMRLLCSDDVVCWMTDDSNSTGRKIDAEYAHTVLLSNILEWDKTETVHFLTPIDSLKYEIEAAKIDTNNMEESIRNYQERIVKLKNELKEMENKDKKEENN